MEGEERRNNEETTMEDETEKLETPKKYPHVGVPSPLHDQTNGSSIGGALLPHQQLLGAGCGANASLAFWAVDSARQGCFYLFISIFIYLFRRCTGGQGPVPAHP